jgi:glucan-binding YG repeat protein
MQFYSAVNSKAVELAGLGEKDEKELDRHRHLFEMKELARLEKRLKIFEQKKIELLKQELSVTARLKYRSRVHGFQLDELEAMYDAEGRRRELTVTKLYARLNNQIRSQITNAEGKMKAVSRKRTPYGDNREEMLFDGIRDQKLKANWLKTP